MRRVADGNCLFFRDDSTAALADSYCDEIEIVHSAGVPGTDAHSISAMVALLLHFVAAENGLDCDLRIAADFTGPVNEPFTIPLDILLVLWRHVLLDRAVLVKSSVQPGMGTDSVSTVENLYRGFGEPDIYLLLDVFKGNRIVHTLHRNVVIGTHRCHFPGGQFKGPVRQRAQEGPFFRKAAGPAALPFLERHVVERLQTVPNRLVQFQ